MSVLSWLFGRKSNLPNVNDMSDAELGTELDKLLFGNSQTEEQCLKTVDRMRSNGSDVRNVVQAYRRISKAQLAVMRKAIKIGVDMHAEGLLEAEPKDVDKKEDMTPPSSSLYPSTEPIPGVGW